MPRRTGHHKLPVGDGYSDFTAVADAMNVTARLASAAERGEAFVTENAWPRRAEAAETRELVLSGRNEPVTVVVMTT